MRRARPLALLACLLFAGCAGANPPTATTVPPASPATAPTTTTWTTAPPTTTPECPPGEHYTAKPLPDGPEEFTRRTAVEFVVTYEKRLAWNRWTEVEKRTVAVRNPAVNETTEGYVVHVSGGEVSFRDCERGEETSGEGPIRATYFLNESVVVRDGDPETLWADPRGNGTVVERW